MTGWSNTSFGAVAVSAWRGDRPGAAAEVRHHRRPPLTTPASIGPGTPAAGPTPTACATSRADQRHRCGAARLHGQGTASRRTTRRGCPEPTADPTTTWAAVPGHGLPVPPPVVQLNNWSEEMSRPAEPGTHPAGLRRVVPMLLKGDSAAALPVSPVQEIGPAQPASWHGSTMSAMGDRRHATSIYQGPCASDTHHRDL